MAELGESWVKEVLIRQGFGIYKLATEDLLAIYDNLALIIEEKDNKYPIKTGYTKAYIVAGRKRFPFKLKQINQHTLKILEEFRIRKNFFNIIQIYVVSNMIGRYVNVIRNYKSHIFFINKCYFEGWLVNLKKVYLGTPAPFPNLYMGGK